MWRSFRTSTCVILLSLTIVVAIQLTNGTTVHLLVRMDPSVLGSLLSRYLTVVHHSPTNENNHNMRLLKLTGTQFSAEKLKLTSQTSKALVLVADCKLLTELKAHPNVKSSSLLLTTTKTSNSNSFTYNCPLVNSNWSFPSKRAQFRLKLNVKPLQLQNHDEANSPRGRNLIVASSELPPYTVFPNNLQDYDKYTGLAFEVLRILSQHLHFSYTVIEPPDQAYGAIVNGTWNGMVGMAIRNGISLAIAPFTVTYPRSKVINFIWPLYEEPTAIVIPAPQEEWSLLACTQPYTNDVWICLVAGLAVVTVLLWLLLRVTWTNVSGYRPNTLIGTQFLFALGVISNQASTCSAYTHSSRVLAGSWCLAAVIIVYVYTSTLTSYLTVRKEVARIDNIEELATKNALKLVILKYSSFELFIMNADTGPYKVLGDYLRRNPSSRVTNAEAAITKVLTGQYAYIVEKSVASGMIGKHWESTGQCQLAEAKEGFFKSYIGLVSPPNSPYNTLWAYKLRQMHETGLITYCVRRTWPKPNPCSSSTTLNLRADPISKKLSLQNLKSAFVILGIGVCLASLVFIAEQFFARIRNETRH